MKAFPIGVLLVLLLVSGCAPAPQKMSEMDRKAVQVVSINTAVAKPPQPYYLGPGGAVGLMFGALGAIATESAREEGRKTFNDFLQQNGISIERIVLDEFSAALRSSGKVSVADNAGAGPTINITIRQYGLSIPHGFSSNLVPILFMVCEMVDSSGRTVWSASDRILPLGNPVAGVPAEELRNDPRKLEAAWRAAARHVSAKIVGEL